MKTRIARVITPLTCRLLGWYWGVVVVFALGYWLVWQTRPDAFIVHDEFNHFPTEQLWQGLGYSGKPDLSSPSTEEEAGLPEGAALRPAIADWSRKKTAVSVQLRDLKARIAEAKSQSNEAVSRAAKAWSANVEAFKSKELGAAEVEIQRRSSEIAALEVRFTKSNGMRTAEGEYQIATARWNLSKAEVQHANQKVKVLSRITDQPRAFDDENLTLAAAKANEILTSLETEYERLNREDLQLNKVGHNLWRRRGATVHNRVGLLDFIYFSLGVSTTTTFGDIIPNSQWARLLVTLQLLTCTLIVGIFVSHVGNTMLRRDTP